jgi:hypothetical protein
MIEQPRSQHLFSRLVPLLLLVVFASAGAGAQADEGEPLWCAIWVSDTQNYSKGGGDDQYLIPLLNAVKQHRPKMILHTGDCIFRWGNKGAWRDMLEVMRESDPPMELHVSPGNHDVDERDRLEPQIARAASLGIYPFDTGRIIEGKGYDKDRETRLVSGPAWPVWNPEVAAHPNWRPGKGGPYFYVFKRGGIRFIVQDYRNDREPERKRLCEELEKKDDSSVSILMQHKVRDRWPHKEDCGGRHNLRLMLSGHYPGYSKGGRPDGVTHIRCASLANVHHGGENDIFLLWVYADHLRLDRYVIPGGAPGDQVAKPKVVWRVDGRFTEYKRPTTPKVPAVLVVEPDGGWFTLRPGQTPDLKAITVRNLGGTASKASLEESVDWLKLSDSSLAIVPYGEKKVSLTWDAARLKEGRQDAVITLRDPKAFEPKVAVEISTIIDTRPPDRRNLLKNPSAEEGMDHWTTGGNPGGWPKTNPDTHGPCPSNHSGKHRFGISWGWTTGDAFQHQTVPVEAGKVYEAGFWVSKMVGSDESVELLWIDGEQFGGKERSLYRTPDNECIDGWWKSYRGARLKPSGDRVTIVLRYRHTHATGIASIHVDDVYLIEVTD